MQLFLFMRINLEKLHNGPLNKLKGTLQYSPSIHLLFPALQVFSGIRAVDQTFQTSSAPMYIYPFFPRNMSFPSFSINRSRRANIRTYTACPAFAFHWLSTGNMQRSIRQHCTQGKCRTVYRSDQQVVFPDPARPSQDGNRFLRQKRPQVFRIPGMRCYYIIIRQ